MPPLIKKSAAIHLHESTFIDELEHVYFTSTKEFLLKAICKNTFLFTSLSATRVQSLYSVFVNNVYIIMCKTGLWYRPKRSPGGADTSASHSQAARHSSGQWHVYIVPRAFPLRALSSQNPCKIAYGSP